MSDLEHWNAVYLAKGADRVSWRQAEPAPSLAALNRFAPERSAALVDVGGGASNLIDALLARGWTDLTVLDLSDEALRQARARIGPAAARVRWLTADVTRWAPGRAFDVWHDRAVFHFFTEPDDRAAYRRALAAGLRPGGVLILAAFAFDGPDRCSGLPVRRWDAAGLAAELGPAFEPLADWREDHATPGGVRQRFTWTVFRRRA
jgi:trans-aconitate methyltransferase